MGREGRKRFVSAKERAKFFMCFWGNEIEFAAGMLDCESRRLRRAAAGCVCSGAWAIGGVQSQAEHILALGCRHEADPRDGV